MTRFLVQEKYSDRTGYYFDKLRRVANMLEENEIRKEVNQKIGDAINRFVPLQGGDLRSSMRVYPRQITWGESGTPAEEYARYQFYGEIYRPNKPIWQYDKGTKESYIVGWWSPEDKYPSGEMLGANPGVWHGWRFGYTTPGTQHHWTDLYKNQVKSTTNYEITMFLRRECKKRGLNA